MPWALPKLITYSKSGDCWQNSIKPNSLSPRFDWLEMLVDISRRFQDASHSWLTHNAKQGLRMHIQPALKPVSPSHSLLTLLPSGFTKQYSAEWTNELFRFWQTFNNWIGIQQYILSIQKQVLFHKYNTKIWKSAYHLGGTMKQNHEAEWNHHVYLEAMYSKSV